MKFNKAAALLHQWTSKRRPVGWFLDIYSDGKTTTPAVVNAMALHLYEEERGRNRIPQSEVVDLMRHIIEHHDGNTFTRDWELKYVIGRRQADFAEAARKVKESLDPKVLNAIMTDLDMLMRK